MTAGWEGARCKAVAAAVLMAARYRDGGDRRDAIRLLEDAALDIVALDLGVSPDAEPWDLERSLELDRAIVAREAERFRDAP